MLQRVSFILLLFSSFVSQADDTILKLYRPYGDAIGQAAPIIKKTLSGQCITQSRLILREDAWRCEAKGKTFDPCFVKAGPNRTEAICPQSPWVGESVRIKVPSPLNNAQNTTLDMSVAYPWAVELANGERCMAIYTTQIFDQMPIRYRCTNKNRLVGRLQRCRSVWSMLEKTPDGVVTSELVKAWF